MKLRLLALPFFPFLTCCSRPAEPGKQNREGLQERLGSNVKICDTCTSVLVVTHQECTECKDLYVDSGTVYVSEQMIKDFAANQTTGKKNRGDKFRLNGFDLYLQDSTDFKKLWPHWDFRPRRVRGKITKLFDNNTPVIRIFSFSPVR